MNIEPFDSNSMKVTLDSEDLERLGIDLHRDTYGSPKMQQLFRRIKTKLRQEYGFNPENQPLAIEAIPVSVEQLVLNFIPIYPEDVGSTYAHFSSIAPEDEEMGLYDSIPDESDSGLLTDDDDSFGSSRFRENSGSSLFFPPHPPEGVSLRAFEKKDRQDAKPQALAVSFRSFQEAGTASSLLPDTADRAESCLFRMGKSQTADSYVLFIRPGNLPDKADMRRLARTLSEYGRVEVCTDARLDYFLEHGTCLIKSDAIAKLRRFS